ncbi:MAG: helix-turn-helix transcriptional regulator [Actinomycetaceae bacterium]|nr:helix-turn-helix transcriptional regulator [Actinomycetaceae bacterium]
MKFFEPAQGSKPVVPGGLTCAAYLLELSSMFTTVTTDVLDRICTALAVDISDICETSKEPTK